MYRQSRVSSVGSDLFVIVCTPERQSSNQAASTSFQSLQPEHPDTYGSSSRSRRPSLVRVHPFLARPKTHSFKCANLQIYTPLPA